MIELGQFTIQWSDILLVVLSFVSSMFTAIIGIGGGILLISVMPGLIPPDAIIPVHGVVQFGSNASRALFVWRSIHWPISGGFTIGAIIGAAVGSQFVVVVPTERLVVILGIFVLLMTWTPVATVLRYLKGKFIALGAVQTGASLFLGATGPLSPPLLARVGLRRGQLVATQAVFMTVQHLAKVIVFGLLGFVFRPYIGLLIGMTVAVTLGSFAGKILSGRFSERVFRITLKAVVTILALRMIFGLGV